MALRSLDAATGGVIQYGTFVFPDAVTLTTACNVTPQYDPGKRIASHVVWDLTLESYIDGSPTDANVMRAVIQLSQSGRAFTYQGHGCTSLVVNTKGGETDLLWGPLPQIVSLLPVGGQNLCKLTWRVTLAKCSDSEYLFHPFEFSYSLGFAIGSNGFTTRTYRAKLRVPNNRLPLG